MAIFSTNQNRQFYVVSEMVSTTPTKEGQLQLIKTKDGSQLCFKHFGKGGLTRTDLIDVNKVTYAKSTPKTEMQRKLKKATITLNPNVNGGNPIVGQDYILRIQVNNYLSPSDACVLIKSSAVHAVKDMTPAQFYEKMVKSLEMNFSRDPQPLLKFETSKSSDTANGIVITEVGDQPWRLGLLSQDAVNFEVIPTTVTCDGEEVIWGSAKYEDTATIVGNGKQVADLEYFCMAERGDRLRTAGWPNNIDVKYMVDPTKEYDMLDIHYYYSGDGVQVHHSDKDITFVSSTDAISKASTGLKAVLTAAGVKVI